MNFIDTKVDKEMVVLGYIVTFLFMTISGTIIIYHNVVPLTMISMGISVIVSGLIVVVIITIREKRNKKEWTLCFAKSVQHLESTLQVTIN